jgi:hypothetical protein
VARSLSTITSRRRRGKVALGETCAMREGTSRCVSSARTTGALIFLLWIPSRTFSSSLSISFSASSWYSWISLAAANQGHYQRSITASWEPNDHIDMCWEEMGLELWMRRLSDNKARTLGRSRVRQRNMWTRERLPARMRRYKWPTLWSLHMRDFGSDMHGKEYLICSVDDTIWYHN